MRNAARKMSRRTWVVLGFSAVIAAGLVFAIYVSWQRNGAVQEPTAAVVSGEPVEAVAEAVLEPVAPAEQNTAEVVAAPVVPVFDIVRIEPDGSALVAGTATPGAVVTVFADASALTEVTADQDGNFVAMFDAVPSVAPQALTLGTPTAGGDMTMSDQVVMLLPEEQAVAEAEEAGDPVSETVVMPEGVVVQSDTTAPEPKIAATAVVRDNRVEVNRLSEAEGPFGFELVSISYSASGAITLTGVGPAEARVLAYLDNSASGEVGIGSDGRWALDLSNVDEGLYALRLDQVDGSGRVVKRVETPFKREILTMPKARPGTGAPVSGGSGMVVTVQPGGTLWTLAQEFYGSGVLFTQIYTANEGLLRDPDLIYPGQVLAIPELQ